MDKDLRRKVFNRAVEIATEISNRKGIEYTECLSNGIEKACSEFNVGVTEFTKSFL